MVRRLPIGYYLTVDIAVTILVISCVVVALTTTIAKARKMVEISAATVEVLDNYRTPVSVLYALHGQWPARTDDVREASPRKGTWAISDRLKEIRVEQGALTVSLHGSLTGERLTVHPSVQSDDPLGPVRWVAGPGGVRNGWIVVGPGHTTINREYIPALLLR